MNADEMERKKERIMMASLRRRQEAEDAKRRKEVSMSQTAHATSHSQCNRDVCLKSFLQI